MKKLFFEKGYTGTEKDTIIQITGFLVLAATFLPCLIVYIALRNDIAILNFKVTMFCIIFIVLFNVIGFVFLLSIKKKMLHGAKETYSTCNYFRDVPNKGYIEVTFTLLYYFHINKWDRANIIGALIIKLLNEGVFELVSDKKVFVDQYEFKINKEPVDDVDKRFYSIIVGAAGTDKKLQVCELKLYLKRNPQSIDYFYKYLIDLGKKKLHEMNAYANEPNYIFDNLSESGLNQIKEIYGLEKFFDDFTILDEREIKESFVWDSYLVYSTLIGNADVVLNKFKEYYPNDLKSKYEDLKELYKNKQLGTFDLFVYIGNRILN